MRRRRTGEARCGASKKSSLSIPTRTPPATVLRWALSYDDDEDEEAARILEGLVAKAPGVALYWGNLGRVLAARAEETLRKAAELEPHNASHWVELSRLCRRQGRYDEAERLIEQAVGADGKVDLQDIDALFELPIL